MVITRLSSYIFLRVPKKKRKKNPISTLTIIWLLKICNNPILALASGRYCWLAIGQFYSFIFAHEFGPLSSFFSFHFILKAEECVIYPLWWCIYTTSKVYGLWVHLKRIYLRGTIICIENWKGKQKWKMRKNGIKHLQSWIRIRSTTYWPMARYFCERIENVWIYIATFFGDPWNSWQS